MVFSNRSKKSQENKISTVYDTITSKETINETNKLNENLSSFQNGRRLRRTPTLPSLLISQILFWCFSMNTSFGSFLFTIPSTPTKKAVFIDHGSSQVAFQNTCGPFSKSTFGHCSSIYMSSTTTAPDVATSTSDSEETLSSMEPINNDKDSDAAPEAKREEDKDHFDSEDCENRDDQNEGQSDAEDDEKKRIKASMAQNLLFKNKSAKGVMSKAKNARTQTSIGPLKGADRKIRASSGGTIGGKILSSVRKNAAVAAAMAEKQRKEKEAKEIPKEDSPEDSLSESKTDSNTSMNSSNQSPPSPTNIPIPQKSSAKDISNSCEKGSNGLKATFSTESFPTLPKTSIIQSTIHKFLNTQEEIRQHHKQQQQRQQPSQNSPEDAGTKPASSSSSMGLFGEKIGPQLETVQKPFPGTILSYPTCYFLNPSSSSYKKLKKSPTLICETETNPIQDAVTVRVATRVDDSCIANLRLSVFSNLNSIASSPYTTVEHLEHVRNQFRIRSCEVIESRRNLGAVCLVASVPKVLKNDFVAFSRNKQRGWRVTTSLHANRRMIEFWESLEEWEREEEFVVGSVECSLHEFYGTTLGKERVRNRILYITEVAVDPDTRMTGIGKKLLQGVDKLAHIRKVESLYLHVDVTNEAAINLYTKAGYVKAEPTPSNLQFTRSLNLHDGATNGRNHYLMCKHLRIPTILDNEKNTNQIDDKNDIGNAIKNSLGFEMPS